MKRLVVNLLGLLSVIGIMAMGSFAADGVCAYVWGPEILTTALGHHPDRSHPAFWTFLVLLVICMLAGAAAAVMGIVLPLHALFNVPITGENGDDAIRQLALQYARRLGELCDTRKTRTDAKVKVLRTREPDADR